VLRVARLALFAALLALIAPTLALGAERMPVGFQDDPSFRWAANSTVELDKAAAANASIIRTTADWRAIAAKKPRSAAKWDDPAYNFSDLDGLVRGAAERGIEVMITIWGTPKWANGGKEPNVPPRHVGDLNRFARAIADRYSGRHAGLPYVGRYSIWNEPNLGIFLSTQFDNKGRIISPRIYANLFKAGRAGIKARNKSALIAIGETSNQGRDHPKKGAPVSVAPGTFARLLAQQKGLRFDAYATHPYATRPNLPPTQRVRWPNVTLSRLKQFETSLDKWFHRKDIPVWITEYGYETKPAEKAGVTLRQQSTYMSKVVRQLRADPRVGMFIWFIFRDSPTSLWQSGVFTQSGGRKPAYKTFSALASLTRGETMTIKPGVPLLVTLRVPRLAYSDQVGTPIGVTYRVLEQGKVVTIGQPQVPLRSDGSIKFVAVFSPEPGADYDLEMDANDINGNHVVHTYALFTEGKKALKKH